LALFEGPPTAARPTIGLARARSCLCLSYNGFIHPPMGSAAAAGENPCATCGL